MTGDLYYLYFADGRYFFHAEENLNKVASDRANALSDGAIDAHIVRKLEEARNRRRDVILYDNDTADVPDTDSVRLVVLPPDLSLPSRSTEGDSVTSEALNILQHRGDASRFRRNTLLFLTAKRDEIRNLRNEVREYLSWDPTTNGKKWLKTTIHTMLDNEAYTGTLVWGTNAKDGAPPVRVEEAFPSIVSKQEFRRAKKLLGSRAPERVHPRRASSPYLLSGILRCEVCGKCLTAAEAKSGKYTYYVCQSMLKRGPGACSAPRLNARTFEKLIVDQIRENVLTESNIRDLVRLLDEEMDGVAGEQRERLATIEGELEDVKRRLGHIWQAIETTDIEMSDASERIKEHRERKERLEIAAEEARGLLSERRHFLDSADTIAAFAEDMSEFLKTSELTETKAFVRCFVKEIAVGCGRAVILYSLPTPEDSPIGSVDNAEVVLDGRVMSTVRCGTPERAVLRSIRWVVPI